MKVEELITKARERGITFIPAPGGKFTIRGPKVPALAEELRKHRKEIVEYLKKDLERQARVGAKMLEECGFLLVYSHRLGKTVAITTNGSPKKGKIPKGAITFTLDEIKEVVEKLKDANAAELVCGVKEILKGTVLEVRELSSEGPSGQEDGRGF